MAIFAYPDGCLSGRAIRIRKLSEIIEFFAYPVIRTRVYINIYISSLRLENIFMILCVKIENKKE